MNDLTKFPIHGLNIPDLPDVSPVTDASQFIMERIGTGRVSASGLADYVSGSLPSGTNLLINGDIRLDQILEGASIAIPTDGGQTTVGPDCWAASGFTLASGLTMQRSLDGPPGLLNSMQITVGTGAPLTRTNDGLIVFQNLNIDQINLLGYGTAYSQPSYASFWIKSHGVTGRYGFSIQTGTASRAWATTFDVPQADVWTAITIGPIPGDAYGAGDVPFSLATSGETALGGNRLLFAGVPPVRVGAMISATNILGLPPTYVVDVAVGSIGLSQVTTGIVPSGANVTFFPPWSPVPLVFIQATFTITLTSGPGFQGNDSQWETTIPIGAGNGGAGPISTADQTAQLQTVSGAWVRLSGLRWTVGNRVPPIQQADRSAELDRSEQFVQKSYQQGIAVGTADAGGPVTWCESVAATFPLAISVPFRRQMAAVPSTITIYSAHTGTPGKVFDSLSGADVAASVTAAGAGGFVVVTDEPLTQAPGKLVQFQWSVVALH